MIFSREQIFVRIVLRLSFALITRRPPIYSKIISVSSKFEPCKRMGIAPTMFSGFTIRSAPIKVFVTKNPSAQVGPPSFQSPVGGLLCAPVQVKRCCVFTWQFNLQSRARTFRSRDRPLILIETEKKIRALQLFRSNFRLSIVFLSDSSIITSKRKIFFFFFEWKNLHWQCCDALNV